LLLLGYRTDPVAPGPLADRQVGRSRQRRLPEPAQQASPSCAQLAPARRSRSSRSQYSRVVPATHIPSIAAGPRIGLAAGRHHRPASLGDILDRAEQQSAISDNRLVRLAQMLTRPVLDRALGFHGPRVVNVDVVAHARVGLGLLLLQVEPVAVRPSKPRPVVRQFVELQALSAHRRLIHRRAEAREDGVPVAGHVVDGHAPLADGHLLAHRDYEGLREGEVGDPDVGARRSRSRLLVRYTAGGACCCGEAPERTGSLASGRSRRGRGASGEQSGAGGARAFVRGRGLLSANG